MKKFFLLSALFAMSSSVFALDGTQWQTIDDKTGKPKAIVQFNKQKNGTYTGRIVKVLDPAQVNGCTTCTGKLKGKSLINVPVVSNLKETSKGIYAGGTIFDPKDGKSYSLKGELKGNKLVLRGYIGFSLIGRNQTWNRVN